MKLSLAFLIWLLPHATAAQDSQEFRITPVNARITVGDSVTLRFRVRLDERDLLIDTVPRPLGPLPSGVRLLSVEKMHRTPDRIFHGQARIVFYRPGRQPVPVFGLPFMRIVEGVERATLSSDSAYVSVSPLLPPGNPALKDIREFEPTRNSPWSFVAGGTLLAVALLFARRRLRRAAPTPVARDLAQQDPSQSAVDPLGIALESLLKIEREQWPERGEVPRHYEAVVNVLRDYLNLAESIPAREQTTAEVLWALPPHLSESGLRDQLRELLVEADLVKFAGVRPDSADAHQFLADSRSLLETWHRTGVLEEPADALR
ncbi:MAG TPA: hypothetical protein VHH32_11165 [Gemmatimonadales bacterium]|nr:hypothetical protein [Gemmatimonadales bacterium]